MNDPDASTPPSATPRDRRRVLLITDDRVFNSPDGPSARLASTRLRLIVALDALNRDGHSARLMANTTPDHIADSATFARAGIVVFGKVFQDYRALADRARAEGKTVVLDVTDDLDRFAQLAAMRALVGHADAFTVPSSAMAALVDAWTGGTRPTHRIPDPLEGSLRPIGGDLDRRPLRLVWYGSPTNAKYLNRHMPDLIALAERVPLEFALVSAGGEGFSGLVARYHPSLRGALGIRFVEWSPQAQEREIEHADLVLLPGDLDGDSALKSANRLITAIAAGRFCVASPLPSYLPFADCALLVDSMAEGIEAACAMGADRTAAAIRAGQELVSRDFSAEVMGRRWVEVLTGLEAPDPGS